MPLTDHALNLSSVTPDEFKDDDENIGGSKYWEFHNYFLQIFKFLGSQICLWDFINWSGIDFMGS